MSTTYTLLDKEGETGFEVAHVSWGGRDMGTRVELLHAAALVDFDETLVGDDGSRASLRSLAARAGRGRCPEYSPCGRPGCLFCDPEHMEAKWGKCLRCGQDTRYTRWMGQGEDAQEVPYCGAC